MLTLLMEQTVFCGGRVMVILSELVLVFRNTDESFNKMDAMPHGICWCLLLGYGV